MSLAVESVSQLVPGTPCLKWRSEGNDSPCEAVVPNVPCRQYNGFNASPRDSRLNVFQVPRTPIMNQNTGIATRNSLTPRTPVMPHTPVEEQVSPFAVVPEIPKDLEHFHKFHSPSATRTASQSTNMSRVLGSGWHNANTTAKIEFRKKLWETPSPRRSERSSLRRYSVNTQRERIQRLRRELVLCPSPERISSSSPQINLFSHDDTSIFA